MFKFILKFFELLSICTIGSFGEWLASDPKGTIKYLSLNNRLCQAKPTLVNYTLMELFFIHLLSEVSAMEVVTLLMIHMLKFVF